MDNTADALYLGAAVLVFMVAVSLTLSSFSTFRNDLEDIILADERIDAAQIAGEYINYISSSEECRTVGIDTLANSLYRVYKENYIVVIKLKKRADYNDFSNPEKELYKYSNLLIKGNGLENIIPTNSNKPNVKVQTYKGQKIINSDDKILVFDIPSAQNDKEYINNALDAGLYKLLKDKTFTEYTGIYYEDDVVEIGTDMSGLTGDSTISVANKTKARVITYIEQ